MIHLILLVECHDLLEKDSFSFLCQEVNTQCDNKYKSNAVQNLGHGSMHFALVHKMIMITYE